MKHTMRTTGVALAGALGIPSWAGALPAGPTTFCEVYPESPPCAVREPDCTFCHTTPPARNPFGAQLEAELLPGQPRPLTPEQYAAGLPDALRAIEAQDADADGVNNLDEILAGTLPADALSKPPSAACPADTSQNGWDVCGYDLRYVFKKVHLDFCGRSPYQHELATFDTAMDKQAMLMESLGTCLDSEYWIGRDGAVWRLAHKKIQPLQSVKSGPDDPGDIPLADYLDDYNLFVYTQIDNRDARELLTAQYFVERDDGPPTTYAPFTRSPLSDVIVRGYDQAQLVDENRRAGMITARWFLMSNTMFTAIPRTTAAQAYRAYLGYDISKMEGLFEVPDEPADYDAKGVQRPECARCHSTLDPLTYPFSRYSGIGGSRNMERQYSYSPDRLNGFTHTDGPSVPDTPEAGMLFGRPVADLVQWAQMAANSDAFARALVRDYWHLLVGGGPTPLEQAEFTALWRDLKTIHRYGIERMLHDLVRTEAYGVP